MESCNMKHKNKPHAILIPLPLQGHIIPFVQLAIRLASKGFSLTFINTKHIHHQISLSNAASLSPDDNLFSKICDTLALDIEYITVSDGLPVEFDRTKSHEQFTAANKYTLPAHVEVAVADIVKARPLVCCLIADSYFAWPSELAKKFGLYYVTFWTESALVLDIYFHLHLLQQNGHVGPGARKGVMIDYIPGVKSIKSTDLTSYIQEEDWTTKLEYKYIFEAMNDTKRADFVLSNTVEELELEAISVIKGQIPFYAIGPLFPPGFTKGPVATSLWAESNCIEWLDGKPTGSVLYVSFGSYAHIRKEELGEIANGIKNSGVNFLWVIRPDMVSSDDPNPLPSGFVDEVGDRGMIITWSNQMAVLAHRSIGGFLTHCGWNSILESIWCEIPLLCFPLLTDQFTNRKLVVDDWRIGCNLCEVKPLRKEEVAKQVKLLVHGESHCNLKGKIKEVKRVLEKAMSSDGSLEKNVDSFIVDILKLDGKNKISSSHDL